MRIGNGFDLHPLVSGRDLILGGVKIPFDKGLEGHSDGDALLHAIIDAILGAAALGDIGMWFPPGDPNYKGANSLDMLATVSKTIADRGYKVGNIDATIICEAPKLSSHFNAMRQAISRVLKVSIDQVNVKATTSEKLGFIGRGEAIACQAVALLV